jgi:hypothetical protein
MPGEGRLGAAGKRSSWRGSARWPTSPVTAPCPPAGTSAASMGGTSDGADWSNGQDWLANWTRRSSRRSDTPPDGALSVPATGASSHAEDAGSHRRRSANLRTPAALRRLMLASRARPQPRRRVCLPVCRHGRGAYAGEFALASCALAVPGEDEGASRRIASAPGGEGARDRVAIGVRFGLREVAGRGGVTREDGGFGADAVAHGCRSRECHGRLPPSPAPSRSTAGLKKRLFLYGPAHGAQMLAKAQGGRFLALRKVGVELYLAAQ